MKQQKQNGKIRRGFFKREEGGTVAELAIIVPFLAVMLAGVTEFGRLFQSYTTLAKSTRTAARYLSNHPFDAANQTKAKNLAACGQLTCGVNDQPLLTGLSANNICIESTGNPNPVSVTVSIPRTGAGCGSPYTYQPIFDLAVLLHAPTFSLNLPLAPSTTMYYMLDN
ncbi:MAG: TadE/TadG family type IV pilus assembly protein [Pyrinomonadaceae bacterium]